MFNPGDGKTERPHDDDTNTAISPFSFPDVRSATMVSNTKLFVLGFLCATAIVLGSGIVTLTLVLHKRKE